MPEDLWPEFKVRATAAYQAPSRAIARDLAEGLGQGLRGRTAQCGRLLHGRLRGDNHALADAGHPPPAIRTTNLLTNAGVTLTKHVTFRLNEFSKRYRCRFADGRVSATAGSVDDVVFIACLVANAHGPSPTLCRDLNFKEEMHQLRPRDPDDE